MSPSKLHRVLLSLSLGLSLHGSVLTFAAPITCVKLLKRVGAKFHSYKLSGRESSLKDLEPAFKHLANGELFELRIPKNVRSDLFAQEMPYRVRHSAGPVDYYPYRLEAATTEEQKYVDDMLAALRSSVELVERAENQNRPLADVWRPNYQDKYFFTLSPTSAKSGGLVGHHGRLNTLVGIVNRAGRYPFMYIDKNGDRVITNENFIRHLESRGVKKLTLYRGQNSFDYYFFRLLLGKDTDKMRREFADWLSRQAANVAAGRGMNSSTINNTVKKLRSKKVTTEEILADLVPATTSALFTSLTDLYSQRWAQSTDHSEVLTLELDLTALPDSYTDNILYGKDLDPEIVFPFAALEQRKALKKALKIKKAKAVE